MKDLLGKVDPKLLKAEVLWLPFAAEQLCISQMERPAELTDFLIAYHGQEILEVASIRRALFTLLPLRVLNDLCAWQGLPQSNFEYDAALILSTAPWTYGSRLPSRVSTELRKLTGHAIPEEYLPSEPSPKRPAIEELSGEGLSSLFEYQQQMSDAVFDRLLVPGSKAMLQMPTGSGKTRTVACALVRWLSQSVPPELPVVLWLAHSEELCEQAAVSFRRSWFAYGDGLAKMFRLWGSNKLNEERLSKGIVLASLQKLHTMRLREPEAFEQVARRVGILPHPTSLCFAS